MPEITPLGALSLSRRAVTGDKADNTGLRGTSSGTTSFRGAESASASGGSNLETPFEADEDDAAGNSNADDDDAVPAKSLPEVVVTTIFHWDSLFNPQRADKEKACVSNGMGPRVVLHPWRPRSPTEKTNFTVADHEKRTSLNDVAIKVMHQSPRRSCHRPSTDCTGHHKGKSSSCQSSHNSTETSLAQCALRFPSQWPSSQQPQDWVFGRPGKHQLLLFHQHSP